MKIMKKFLCALCSLVLVLVGSISCFALDDGLVVQHETGYTVTDLRVIHDIEQGVTVDGIHIEVPAFYLNQAENWLRANHLTESAADYALSQAANFRAVCQSEHLTSIEMIRQSATAKSLALGVANALGFTLTKTAQGWSVTYKGQPVITDEKAIKATGADYKSIIEAISVVSLISIGLVVFAVRKPKKVLETA